MATPTPKRSIYTSGPVPATPQGQAVNPRWLLRALLISFAAAAILAYCALCLLVSMGSRQMILHPTSAATPTPAIPFTPSRFDSATTGSPRLTAWWISSPESPGAPSQSKIEVGSNLPASTTPTILLLHDGRDSLPATLPLITLLHQANINVFAIDYRGFGASLPLHPTQQTMQQDADAALLYLTQTRHIPASSIIPLGTGLGAVLAATLARTNPSLPALILDNPDLTTIPTLLNAPRARLLPMRYLLADHFDLEASLRALPQPVMLIFGGPTQTTPQPTAAITPFLASIPRPALTLTLPTAAPEACSTSVQDPTCPGPAFTVAITRFLDSNSTPRTTP